MLLLVKILSPWILLTVLQISTQKVFMISGADTMSSIYPPSSSVTLGFLSQGNWAVPQVSKDMARL